MRTLWDLLAPLVRPPPVPKRPPRPPRPGREKGEPSRRPTDAKPTPGPAPASRVDDLVESLVARGRSEQPLARPRLMRDRYAEVADRLCRLHGVRVRRWRSSTSGIAVRQTDRRTGKVKVYIEAPEPKGPMSCAVFLHEVGHVAIGVGAVKPRCLEEYAAWRFAVRTMEEEGLNVTAAVRARVDLALRYAVAKARRRGLKSLPAELAPYATRLGR